MIKFVIPLVALFISFESIAANYPNMTSVKPIPENEEGKSFYPALSNSAEYYKPSNHGDYKGRNTNIVNTLNTSVSSNQGRLSKNVVSENKSNLATQVENLSSTTGELIQKIDDDRVEASKAHQKTFEDNRNLLVEIYEAISKIDMDKLGKEQDPYVSNAFKCKDIDGDCNTSSGNDDRDIPNCDDDERIVWTGKKWKCYGVFEKPATPSCDSSTQWKRTDKHGNIYCIDYVYFWVDEGTYGSCDSEGNKYKNYKCVRKQEADAKASVDVPDSNCLGNKPSVYISC